MYSEANRDIRWVLKWTAGIIAGLLALSLVIWVVTIATAEIIIRDFKFFVSDVPLDVQAEEIRVRQGD